MPPASFRLLAQLAALASLCTAHLSLEDLRSRVIEQRDLAKSYNYIIVGGGQAGIVIANRLTEDPTKTVLVVEYGWLNDDPAQLDPPSAVNYLPKNLYNVTAQTNEALTGSARDGATVWAAAVVGGGSTVNGMMLDRAAPEDYDNWGKLGNTGWSFNDLLPYFRKSTHLNIPPPEVKDFNITYDLSAYGNGPVQLSYPTWQWPTTKVQWKAMTETGLPVQKEMGLAAYGIFWYPAAMDPKTWTRSYAVSGYYTPVAARKNLHLLTWTRVNEVLFDKKLHATGVTIQARDPPVNPELLAQAVTTVTATTEIIISAGFLHTPHVLQRSGIGPKALLQKAGIKVLVDLPGVGANFQDHSALGYTWQYANDLTPNSNSLFNNETFYDWANTLWTTNRTGPMSLTAPGNSGAWVSLPKLTADYKDIIARIKAQNVTTYLPKSYTPENIAGYQAQLQLMLASFASEKSAVLELPFSGRPGGALSLEHPLSRGTITLNTTDKYADPLVWYNTMGNPEDAVIATKFWLFVRKWMSTPTHQTLGPVELVPGPDVVSDADLLAAVYDSAGSTTAHGCCSAAMMPRKYGGVVAPDLTVYGVTGLSVADISIMPLEVATHTCSTVYAIAEKAADMIKARHRV